MRAVKFSTFLTRAKKIGLKLPNIKYLIDLSCSLYDQILNDLTINDLELKHGFLENLIIKQQPSHSVPTMLIGLPLQMRFKSFVQITQAMFWCHFSVS